MRDNPRSHCFGAACLAGYDDVLSPGLRIHYRRSRSCRSNLLKYQLRVNLRVLVRSETWQITCRWQNSNVLSSRHVFQALHQTISYDVTNDKNEFKICYANKFSKTTISISFNLRIQVCPSELPFVLAVFIPSLINCLKRFNFYVSLKLVAVSTVWLLIHFAT